eukprot:773688-Prorocentrum_minimum.AAC.1
MMDLRSRRLNQVNKRRKTLVLLGSSSRPADWAREIVWVAVEGVVSIEQLREWRSNYKLLVTVEDTTRRPRFNEDPTSGAPQIAGRGEARQ